MVGGESGGGVGSGVGIGEGGGQAAAHQVGGVREGCDGLRAGEKGCRVGEGGGGGHDHGLGGGHQGGESEELKQTKTQFSKMYFKKRKKSEQTDQLSEHDCLSALVVLTKLSDA